MKRKRQLKRNKGGKKLMTFFKVILPTLFTGVLALVACFVVVVTGFVMATPAVDVDEIDLDFTSIVYYTDPVTGADVEFEQLYGQENRKWVDLADIPLHVKNAAVAIEDERFYKHFGVDIMSTAKAFFMFSVQNETSRGGSTITQQLVKSLTGEGQKTPLRKVQEMIKAVILERSMSKDQILELYLNNIYLSQGCNGIASAARFYFGKEIDQLSIAEGASLIGITQFPTRYDPILNPENNKSKQELVLSKMLELGYLSQDEHDEAVFEELNFKPKLGEDALAGKQSYFVDAIFAQVSLDLQNIFGYSEDEAVKAIYSDGLRIYSTLDPTIQAAIDRVFLDDSNFPKAPTDIQPQSSMTIIDHTNGHVKGIVGGRGEKVGNRVLNRATQSTRQPGSTVKPIAVYAPALDKKLITPGTVLTDKKVTFGKWSPANYYSGYRGAMTVRYAVQISNNTIPVQLLDKLGLKISFDYMQNKLGFTTLVEDDKNYSALALGGMTYGVTNIELTAAYAAIANKGVYNKPVLYTKIVDNNGKIILENNPSPSVAFDEAAAATMTDMLIGVVSAGTGTAANFSGKYSIAGKTGTTDDDIDRWFVGFTPYYVGTVWFGYDIPQKMNFLGVNPTIPVWRKVMQEIHEEKGLPSVYFPSSKSQEAQMIVLEMCTESGDIATEACVEAQCTETEFFAPGSAPKDRCTVHFSTVEETPEPVDEPGKGPLPVVNTTPLPTVNTTPSPAPTTPMLYRVCSESGKLAKSTCPPESVYTTLVEATGSCDAH